MLDGALGLYVMPTGGLVAVLVFVCLLAIVGLSIWLGRLSASPGGRRFRLPAFKVGAWGHFWRLGPKQRAQPPSVSRPRMVVRFMSANGSKRYQVELRKLEGAGLTIGRSSKHCDLVVADKMVSSKHARIWRDERGFQIQDLNSTNGVWLGGRRIANRITFQCGDLIRLGGTSFHIEIDRRG